MNTRIQLEFSSIRHPIDPKKFQTFVESRFPEVTIDSSQRTPLIGEQGDWGTILEALKPDGPWLPFIVIVIEFIQSQRRNTKLTLKTGDKEAHLESDQVRDPLTAARQLAAILGVDSDMESKASSQTSNQQDSNKLPVALASESILPASPSPEKPTADHADASEPPR